MAFQEVTIPDVTLQRYKKGDKQAFIDKSTHNWDELEALATSLASMGGEMNALGAQIQSFIDDGMVSQSQIDAITDAMNEIKGSASDAGDTLGELELLVKTADKLISPPGGWVAEDGPITTPAASAGSWYYTAEGVVVDGVEWPAGTAVVATADTDQGDPENWSRDAARSTKHAGSVLYIEDFGGVGDGVTDCSPALQAALDSLPASRTSYETHGTSLIIFPTLTNGSLSVFRFDSKVTIAGSKSVAIQGESGTAIGAQILNMSGDDYVWDVGNTSVGHRLSISGLGFYGGGVSIPDRVRGQCYIGFNLFYSCPDAGVLLQNDSGGYGPVGVRVRDNVFYRCRKGVNIDASTYLIYTLADNRYIEMLGVCIEVNGPGGTIQREDFQGVAVSSGEPFVWFRGAPSNSSDNNSTQWRLRDCRFGGEAFTRTINSVEVGFDVPANTIVLGELGQPVIAGHIIFSGNHFRGRAGGGGEGVGERVLMCHSKPTGCVFDKTNLVAFGNYSKPIIGQSWVVDPSNPTEAESLDGSIIESPQSLNAWTNANDYLFDNGNGTPDRDGIGWEWSNLRPEEKVVLRNGAYITHGGDNGFVGGETDLDCFIRVGLQTTRPSAPVTILGSSSDARIVIELQTDGTLRTYVRKTSGLSETTSSLAIPSSIPPYYPIWIRLRWESGVVHEISYSTEQVREGADVSEWVILDSSVPTTGGLNALLATATYVISNTVPYDAAKAADLDFHSLKVRSGGLNALLINADWFHGSFSSAPPTGGSMSVNTNEAGAYYKTALSPPAGILQV